MNNILKKDLDFNKVTLGILIVIIGLAGLLYAPALISIFSLAITSYIGLYIVFGKNATKGIFGKPISPVKNIVKYLLLNILVSILVSVILQNVLKWDLHGNPVDEGFQLLTLFVIPIMLLGEELFSIFFLAIFSSKFSLPIASILSAIIFGLIHYSTYNNGNIVHTLAHILFIQGIARILFNQSAVKSNSILTSWATHVLFDFIAILIVFFTA